MSVAPSAPSKTAFRSTLPALLLGAMESQAFLATGAAGAAGADAGVASGRAIVG